MEKITLHIKRDWATICLVLLLIITIVIIVMLIGKKSDNTSQSQEPVVLSKSSDLIDFKEIALLSTSECVCNGIAQYRDSSGEIMYDALYKSTVKVNVDVEKIKYTVDDEQKKIIISVPEFVVEDPVIDVDSIQVVSPKKNYPMSDIIACCRQDALKEVNKNDQFLTIAKENLQAVIEAWYSPVLEGYTFAYEFDAAESGEES